MKTDQTKALDMFNNGERGFLDRDIFPFCFNLSDGKNVATQTKALGKDIRTFKDPTGKAFGAELYAAAEKPEGQITEVSYMLLMWWRSEVNFSFFLSFCYSPYALQRL